MSTQVSLQPLHTFHLSISAKKIVTVSSAQELHSAWREAMKSSQPVLLLGGGSNILFLEDFAGTVIVNRIKGIETEETEASWLLHVGAGENWHQLVCYTLSHGMAGLENLALIPGCAGTAPIQNIGAYGVELQRVCAYVDVMDLRSGDMFRLTNEECHFGYRESIFKHQYQHGYAIVAVGLSLAKQWQPMLDYGELKQLSAEQTTPKEVFERVCAMRRSKLPDPDITGNAGSFFKNPIVDKAVAQAIVAVYPDAPVYAQADGSMKLAAGWLIDRCDLKGFQMGGAAVHEKQALVLINKKEATGDDIVSLARYVRRSVLDKFGVMLEPEVRFVGAYGEINAVELIS